MTEDIRDQIVELVESAQAAIPSELVPDLPPGKYTSGQPEFHGFEWRIWKLGEDIRQLILKKKALRNDELLQKSFLRISTNPRAKRGRQSFIMLLGFKSCQEHSCDIASQVDDPCVTGHVIDTLLKMRAGGFAKDVAPHTQNKFAWTRKKAKTYCDRFGDS